MQNIDKNLNTLEQTVVTAHTSVTRLEGSALAHAMDAGDALIEILHRKLVRHGRRGGLYVRTCGSKRTAQVYVLLAQNRALLESNAQSSAHLSIAAALKLIRQAKGTSRSEKAKPPKTGLMTVWNAATPAEQTALLADIGFDAFLKIMPPEWIVKFESRSAVGTINRISDFQISARRASNRTTFTSPISRTRRPRTEISKWL
jgi:hypothetical protein